MSPSAAYARDSRFFHFLFFFSSFLPFFFLPLFCFFFCTLSASPLSQIPGIFLFIGSVLARSNQEALLCQTGRPPCGLRCDVERADDAVVACVTVRWLPAPMRHLTAFPNGTPTDSGWAGRVRVLSFALLTPLPKSYEAPLTLTASPLVFPCSLRLTDVLSFYFFISFSVRRSGLPVSRPELDRQRIPSLSCLSCWHPLPSGPNGIPTEFQGNLGPAFPSTTPPHRLPAHDVVSTSP